VYFIKLRHYAISLYTGIMMMPLVKLCTIILCHENKYEKDQHRKVL